MRRRTLRLMAELHGFKVPLGEISIQKFADVRKAARDCLYTRGITTTVAAIQGLLSSIGSLYAPSGLLSLSISSKRLRHA